MEKINIEYPTVLAKNAGFCNLFSNKLSSSTVSIGLNCETNPPGGSLVLGPLALWPSIDNDSKIKPMFASIQSIRRSYLPWFVAIFETLLAIFDSSERIDTSSLEVVGAIFAFAVFSSSAAVLTII